MNQLVSQLMSQGHAIGDDTMWKNRNTAVAIDDEHYLFSYSSVERRAENVSGLISLFSLSL